nr:MAG TPA: hypothetical protein [Caudoviricetes sp.]
MNNLETYRCFFGKFLEFSGFFRVCLNNFLLYSMNKHTIT